MTGRIDSHAKLTHGHPLPDHLNPAKQPGGKLRNDHEAGTSKAAQSGTEAVPAPAQTPAAAPAHVPGQDAPSSLRAPAPAQPHGEGSRSGDSGASGIDLVLPPRSPDSPLPAWITGEGRGGIGSPDGRASASPPLSDPSSMANNAGLTLQDQFDRSGSPGSAGPRPASPDGATPHRETGAPADVDGSSSEGSSIGDILGMMGGGKFKNWDDIRAGLNRNEEFDQRLDKNPFIAAHLDPDRKSPDHDKLNWTRLPDSNHPMFSDFVITQNPLFYSFRNPEQRSAPASGDRPPVPDATPDLTGPRLGRTQSAPAGLETPSDPVHPLALAIPDPAPGANAPGRTLGQFLENPLTPSDTGSPPAPRHDAQAGAAPRPNAGAGQDMNLFPSGAGSEDLDLMNAVIGNPGKWGDLEAGIQKMKEEDARLGKHPFIAAHLDPEKPSPDRAKTNWDKRPAPDHPLFPEYLMAEHPEFYASGLDRRHSGPQPGGTQSPPAGGARLQRSQSLPNDLSMPLDPAFLARPSGTGAPANAGTGVQAAAGNPAPGAAAHDAQDQAQAPRPEGAPAGNDASAPAPDRTGASNYKAYVSGVAGAGLGFVAGLALAGGTEDDAPAKAPDNA